MVNQRNKRSLQTPNYLMTYLPPEITMIVLSNLPVKSLLRFKCVSKSWRSWISSPKFELSNQRRQRVITIKENPVSFRLINQQLNFEELYDPFMMRGDKSYRGTFRVLGSCHGLILININKHIYLWNPATRFYNKVLDQLNDLNLDDYYTSGGLCFDSSKNAYNVVLIMHQDNGGKFVIIASLEDKKWRKLKFPYGIFSICKGITLHERIHFMARVEKRREDDKFGRTRNNEIIYFDPIFEMFHMFPVPEPKSDQVENVIVGLGALKECLCITRLDNDKRGIEILVMKEYGVKESWTSLFFIRNNVEIDPSYDLAMPFTVSETGEVALIIDSYAIELVVYNPKYDNMPKILVDENAKYILYAINYVESLLSPKEYYTEVESGTKS